MARKSQDVTQAEQAVLEALWAMDTATIRQLTDELYPSGTASSFSSVQKLLERLESKGFVKRKRSGSVYLFRALVDRQELIGRRLKAVLIASSLDANPLRGQAPYAEDTRSCSSITTFTSAGTPDSSARWSAGWISEAFSTSSP